MKTISAIFTLLVALTVSGVAAYFSVVGLGALFSATFIPVVVMATTLEVGKLVAVQWLHMNWRNPNVNLPHKIYKTLAIIALMLITSIGIYGFLSKGHLEQSAPIAGIELQISQRELQIKTLQESNTSLQTKLTQLDKSIDSYLSKDNAAGGLKARASQKSERANIDLNIKQNNTQINKLNDEILPLKMQTNEVEAKLGPIKYVAELFGWSDTGSAVRLVIGILMFAFDPFGIVMLISATLTFKEIEEEKKNKLVLIPTVESQSIMTEGNVTVQSDTGPLNNVEIIPDVDLVDSKTDFASVAPVLNIEHDDEHYELDDEDEDEEVGTIDNVSEPTIEDQADIEYREALRKFVQEAYLDKSPESTIPTPTPTPTEKQQLIELLEKQPGLLEVMIDVISGYKTIETPVQTATDTNSEVVTYSPEIEEANIEVESVAIVEPDAIVSTKPKDSWL